MKKILQHFILNIFVLVAYIGMFVLYTYILLPTLFNPKTIIIACVALIVIIALCVCFVKLKKKGRHNETKH